MRVLGLLLVLIGLAFPGSAHAAVTLAQGPATPGFADLVATQDPAADDLRVVEQVGGTEVPVPSAPSAAGLDARAPWTCLTTRTFVAVAGAERSAPLTVTTPPCANRLRLASVHSVGLGGNLRVTLIDRWQRGGFTSVVCARPPHGHRRCETVPLPPGQWVRHAVFRTTQTGTWRVSVRDPWHAVSLRPVTVRKQRHSSAPTVLFTGDSMMLATQHTLRHRLRGKATTINDTYVGSGLDNAVSIDWAKLPGRQVRAYHPDATVITLGMDDGGDLQTPDGPIRCCGDDFGAAYAQRVRTMLRTYLQHGRGAVVWLNVPLARDPRRWPSENAVNAAVAQAALGLDRVRIVDVAGLLTPNGWEGYRTINGKRVRLRTSDGSHLTHAAAGIVATPVLNVLEQEFGVVAG